MLVDVLNASQLALQRGGGLSSCRHALPTCRSHAFAVPGAPGACEMSSCTRLPPRTIHPLLRSAAQDCLPAISRLIDSCYEDYLLCGLTTTASLLKPLAPLLRETLEVARADGSHGGAGLFRGSAGVDLASEERRDRCVAVRDGLLELQPRLVALAAGRGGRRSWRREW